MTTSRKLAALLASALAASTALLIGGGPAGARAVPYTDPASTGAITLCDVAGHVLTSGDTRAKPFVWRAVASHAAPSQYGGQGRTAALYGYQPINGVYPQQWNGDYLTFGAAYTSRSRPMAAATAADRSLADLLSDYPTKWDGLMQLRMFLGAPQRATLTQSYATATIRVTGHTWRLVSGGHSGCATGTSRSGEQLLPSVRKLKAPNEKQYSDPESVFGSAKSGGKGSTGRSAAGSRNGPGSGASDDGAGTQAAAGGSSQDAAQSSSSGSSATLWLVGVCLVVAISGGLFWWRQRSGSPNS